MATLPFVLMLLALQCLDRAHAAPLIRRQDQSEYTGSDPVATSSSSSGALERRWVVVIAVVFSVVVLGVIGTVFWVRQRRARGPPRVRSSSPYDCIRQPRHRPVSEKQQVQSEGDIAMPLPVVAYDRRRSPSPPTPKRSSRS